jgi:DNA mismatch repair protein MutS2
VLELPKVLNIVSEYCQSEPAKNKAAGLSPLKTQSAAELELHRVLDIRNFGESVQFFVPFSPGELRTVLAVHAFLPVDALFSVRLFLIHAGTLRSKYKKSPIREYFAPLHECQDLAHEIGSKIDEDKQIRDNATPALHKIRMRKKTINNRVREILKDLLVSQPHMFTDPNIVIRNNRHVVPVKANFKNEMKGIVHSYSNSGETVFIEPIETTELSAELVELNKREEDEIEAILTMLTLLVKGRIDDIESDLELIVNLDLLFARAAFAREFSCTMPVFGSRIDIRDGFHPVLRKYKEDIVPLNLAMSEDKRVLLISGPNAGGKTVVLKTVGLLVLMAKCGLFITAKEGTVLPFFQEVYADIGDEQSLESDLSTFAGHIKQIRAALQARNGSTLVLMDELMNQTSVEEGFALASAIMEEFAMRKGTVLATTHNESLKIFVSKRKDMMNAGMEFTDRPTYRLISGIPQPSNAIKLASQMGIGADLIERARSYLDSQKVTLNEMFDSLAKELSTVQDDRKKLDSLIAEYEKRVEELKLARKKEVEGLKEKYKKELVQARRTIDRLVRTLKKEGAKSGAVKEARDYFEEKLKDEPAQPYCPIVGELVRIRGSDRIGTVFAVRQGKYKISFNNMFFWVEPRDIEPLPEKDSAKNG